METIDQLPRRRRKGKEDLCWHQRANLRRSRGKWSQNLKLTGKDSGKENSNFREKEEAHERNQEWKLRGDVKDCLTKKNLRRGKAQTIN